MPDMLTTAENLGIELGRFPMHYSPFFQASLQKVSSAEDFAYRFSEDFLKSCNLTLNLNDDMFHALVLAGQSIQANEDLLRWAGFYHYLLYDTRVIRENPGQFSIPVPSTEVLGAARDLFILMAQLSGMDRSIEKYRMIGTPDEVIRDTYHDVYLGILWFHTHYGKYGFRNHGWMTYHAHTRIFQLGRLQFVPGSFRGDVEVYRHKETGELLTLAQDRSIFADDGLRVTADEEAKLKRRLEEVSVFDRNKVLPAGYWMTDHDHDNVWLRQGQHEWLTRILPDGTAERVNLQVDWPMYDRVLGEGSSVLTIHIPKGSPLKEASVRDALERAIHFFSRERFGWPFDAFVIRGWVMDPQFDIIISRPSNIRDLQEAFHLYPVPRDEQSGLRAIYGPHIHRDLPQDWPQETRLQRQLIQVRGQGYKHTEGGGFILRDELVAQMLEEGRVSENDLERMEAHKLQHTVASNKKLEKHELSG